METETYSQPTILLVDDTPATISIVRAALKDAGYRLTIATSGAKALQRAALVLPDLILLDVVMHGMDGYDTCRQLKAQESTRDIPVIFLSAITETFDKVKGLELGAVDFLTKPIVADELLARVNTHITISRLQWELRKANRTLEERVAERTAELSTSNARLVEEITERKRAEESLRRTNRKLVAISNCNQTLLRATHEQALLDEICCIVCVEAGYRMAWVGYAEHDEAKSIRPVGWAGVEQGYLATVNLTWADTERGRGPAGTAIRKGVVDCIQDFATDSMAAPWCRDALQRGYRSCIALPLKGPGGMPFGAFMIYSTEPDAFTPEEARLLQELADDLAFGISTLRLREQHSEAEERLRQAKNAADEANKAKDRFLAVLSHELRTPLTPVLATVTALEAQTGVPEQMREDIELIRRNVILETKLIDDLLDFTRLSCGKLRLHCEVVDVHACLDAALRICHEQIRAKAFTVSMDLQAGEYQVWADSARLQQVFWNLLQNAAKFTPEHGSIHLRSRNKNGRIQITVQDTGIGIEPAMLTKIFDMFVQAEQAKVRRFGGVGLGLSIAKSIMDLHHGELFAWSDGFGKGATFTVEIAAFSSQSTTAELPPALPEPNSRPLNILLVEDNPDTLKVISRILRKWSYNVTTAESVQTAMERAAVGNFDLLVSDIGLPDGSGLDIMQHLKETRGLRGIAISGYGMDEDIRLSLDAGFTRHLTKPLSTDALLQALRELVPN